MECIQKCDGMKSKCDGMHSKCDGMKSKCDGMHSKCDGNAFKLKNMINRSLHLLNFINSKITTKIIMFSTLENKM